MRQIQASVSYRIPIVGGFTDFPEFYRGHGGETISCAIDRGVSITVRQNKRGGLSLRTEADLPAGMGLGSSGAFHAALVMALARGKGCALNRTKIAGLAYSLEAGIDRHATGRQDALACLHRGFTRITYAPDDSVAVQQIAMPKAWRAELQKRLLLFDTGERRQARHSIQDVLAKRNESALGCIAKLPGLLREAWASGNIDFLGQALDLQESYRRLLSPTCRSRRTDRFLEIARSSGAGARLIGAGTGALLCYCPELRQRELKRRLAIPQIHFSILW